MSNGQKRILSYRSIVAPDEPPIDMGAGVDPASVGVRIIVLFLIVLVAIATIAFAV
jgi:hypothetical protein